MDQLCDSDADYADSEHEVPEDTLPGKHILPGKAKDTLCGTDSEDEVSEYSEPEVGPEIGSRSQVSALLDSLPQPYLTLLMMHLNTLMAMCGGTLLCGTLCSGTDLVVVWICSFFRMISERF